MASVNENRLMRTIAMAAGDNQEGPVLVTAQTNGDGGIAISSGGTPVLVSGLRSPALPRAVDTTPPRGLGVRPDSMATLTAQETWLGAPVDHIVGFAESANGANPWSQNLTDTQNFISTFAASGRQIYWAFPICTGTQPITETIAGTHDAIIRQIGEAICAAATGPAIHIRIGWEPNLGSAYPWCSTFVTAQQYKEAYRRVAKILRSIDSRVVTCFCVSYRNDAAWPFEDLYPGDDYVDVIGIDAYILSSDKGAKSDAEHAEYMFSGPCGINRVRDFASARGKTMSINEWGTNYDNSIYIERMADFVRSNAVAYHAYWDQNNGAFTCKLSADQWPNAAYAFVRNFGPFHIDTWAIPANPGQPLAGQIVASKPVSRIEILDGTASVVGRTGIAAPAQMGGARRITVKAFDERGQSAARSIVLVWSTGRIWTPADFGAALVDWHSADFSMQLTRHIGAVKQATSLVGSARSAAAPAAAQRPTYVYRSGRPALSLDGGDALVQSAFSGAPDAQAAVTYAAMIYVASATPNFTYFLADCDANTGVRALGYNGGNLRVGAAGGYAGGNIADADHSIVVSFGAGATAACRGGIDGNAPNTGSVAIPATAYTRRVAGANGSTAGAVGNYVTGYLYEWFSTNAVMTVGEEDRSHGYLAWKYGRESALPTGHAYKSAPPTV